MELQSAYMCGSVVLRLSVNDFILLDTVYNLEVSSAQINRYALTVATFYRFLYMIRS